MEAKGQQHSLVTSLSACNNRVGPDVLSMLQQEAIGTINPSKQEFMFKSEVGSRLEVVDSMLRDCNNWNKNSGLSTAVNL